MNINEIMGSVGRFVGGAGRDLAPTSMNQGYRNLLQGARTFGRYGAPAMFIGAGAMAAGANERLRNREVGGAMINAGLAGAAGYAGYAMSMNKNAMVNVMKAARARVAAAVNLARL